MDYTIRDQYKVHEPHNVELDLEHNKIYVWKEGEEKNVLKIIETHGPLYQSIKNNNDLFKYYQFTTELANGSTMPVRYYLDEKMGLFIILNQEPQQFLRHYNIGK